MSGIIYRWRFEIASVLTVLRVGVSFIVSFFAAAILTALITRAAIPPLSLVDGLGNFIWGAIFSPMFIALYRHLDVCWWLESRMESGK